LKAHLLTIGTEITSGEVVNTNAAWISTRVEELGMRVHSHLTVRDQREEILAALKALDKADVLVVTGGLGPTSDDITRQCVAEHCVLPLEFDQEVWNTLQATYLGRGLKLLEAHKQQCYFPRDSARLPNSVGTALGFSLRHGFGYIYVLPGPPREMEAVWTAGCEPHLQAWLGPPDFRWERWTCLGLPESEVADRVEPVIAGTNLEVGYRAAIPYVKVKLCVQTDNEAHAAAAGRIDGVLKSHLVGKGNADLAEEFLTLWPEKTISVSDDVCDGYLSHRLYEARRARDAGPKLLFALGGAGETDVQVKRDGDGFVTKVLGVSERMVLPYKWSLDSERGKRSAAEWVLWTSVKALRAASRKS
jgi:molybdenum cofactor synthesis domain-containing protein